MVQFIDLWRGHPTNESARVPCLGLAIAPPPTTGTTPAAIVPRNPSATLIGIALRRAGVRIESFPPRIATCSAHDKSQMHFLYPRQVAEALRKSRPPGFGEMEMITGEDISSFQLKLVGRTGLLYVRDYWQRPTDIEGRPTGDLIDLWNGYRTTDAWLMDWMAWAGYSSAYTQAREMWFWPVP